MKNIFPSLSYEFFKSRFACNYTTRKTLKSWSGEWAVGYSQEWEVWYSRVGYWALTVWNSQGVGSGVVVVIRFDMILQIQYIHFSPGLIFYKQQHDKAPSKTLCCRFIQLLMPRYCILREQGGSKSIQIVLNCLWCRKMSATKNFFRNVLIIKI